MKNKIYSSLFWLIILGGIAKLLSTIARITTTRIVGVEGMSIYSLVAPLMVFIISLSQQGLPTAISKLVSSDYKNRKKYVITSYFIGLISSIIIMFFIISFAPLIAQYLLNNTLTVQTLYMTALLSPLVMISSFLKAYLIGIKKTTQTAISQIFEELGRISFIVIFGSLFVIKGAKYGAMAAMIGVCVGEVFQILSLFFSHLKPFSKNIKNILKSSLDKENYDFNSVNQISLPITFSRLITSFTYALEPIILTNILLKMNFTSSFISLSYSELSTYAMPLLFLPGFFANSFATILLPNMSKDISENNLNHAKLIFIKIMKLSFLIGFIFCLIIFLFASPLLKLLYGKVIGLKYVKILAFPCIIYYLEAPINTAMHALSLDKEAFKTTFISCLIRILLMILFVPYFNVIGIEYAMIISVLYIIIKNLSYINKYLFKRIKNI